MLQAIPVPPGGKVLKNLSSAPSVSVVFENPEDRVAPEAAEAGDPDIDAAAGQALREDIALGGNGFLAPQPGGTAVQQQVHGEAGPGVLFPPGKDPVILQNCLPPDKTAVQPSPAGKLLIRLLVDQNTVIYLL